MIPVTNGMRLFRLAFAFFFLGLPNLTFASREQIFDEDHMLAVNGSKLHFRIRGHDRSNPYLLILHGGPGSSGMEFYPWGSQLEPKLNVVYLDQRGSGLSERKPFKSPESPTLAEAEPFRFENQIRDIEAVRKDLKLMKWFVLGHSFGGMVGVEYVTAFSEHVSGYIHMDGLTSMPSLTKNWVTYGEEAIAKTRLENKPEDRARIATVESAVSLLRKMSDENRNAKLGELLLSNLWPERMRDRLVTSNEYDRRIDAEVLKHYKVSPEMLQASEPSYAMDLIENLGSRTVFSQLKDLKVPTLIINAIQDPIITVKDARKMASLVPNAKLVLVDKAGHEVYKDQPLITSKAVLEFMRSIK